MSKYILSIIGDAVTIEKIEVTESEALARVTPPEPVESPDDWVEITDSEHVLRKTIDMVQYDDSSHWYPVDESTGAKLKDVRFKKARCRRKDVPAKQTRYQSDVTCSIAASERERKEQPATKRVPVRLWVKHDTCSHANGAIVIAKNESPDDEMIELIHDGDGFFVEVTE
jgi:hypothetical protein